VSILRINVAVDCLLRYISAFPDIFNSYCFWCWPQETLKFTRLLLLSTNNKHALPNEATLMIIFNISVPVTIAGDLFRGFFLQARDVATGAWVGRWEEAPNTKGLPECAAITHGDNKDKVQATVVWTAPPSGPGGQVFFTWVTCLWFCQARAFLDCLTRVKHFSPWLMGISYVMHFVWQFLVSVPDQQICYYELSFACLSFVSRDNFRDMFRTDFFTPLFPVFIYN